MTHSCDGGCDAGRRDFLRGTSLALALLFTVGARQLSAAQLVVREITGEDAGGARVRYPLPATDGVVIDRERDILLTRWDGRLYAFSMICPHQRAAVKWVESGSYFQCTKHKSRYAGDGAYVSGRATRSLDRFAVEVAGGDVSVDTDRLLRQDRDGEAWRAAFAQL